MNLINILSSEGLLFLLLFDSRSCKYSFAIVAEIRFRFLNAIINTNLKVIMMILSYSKFDF